MQALGVALLVAPRPARAIARLAPPEGPVLLTVRGAIAMSNEGNAARLDRDQLLGWGADELRTTTPFTDGISTFRGVRAGRLLDGLGASGTTLQARALNDYSVNLPIDELRSYPVLLALDRDGKPLAVRDRGPIWVVYPWAEHPELDDRVHRQRSIWQLTELEVR